MHELGITQSILNIALHHARQASAVRINHVNLVIGELSSVVDDSVQFYFDFISEDTLAHGAVLNFERIPARFRCHACEMEFSPVEREWICPQCGEWTVDIIAGKEFYVDSIEVE